MKESTYTHEENAKIEEANALVKKVLKDKNTEKSSSEPQLESVTAKFQQNPAGIEETDLETDICLAKELRTTIAHFVKKKIVEDTKKVVEYTKAVQGLIAKEAGDLLKTTMEVKWENAGCSEAGTSEAPTSDVAETRGNNSIHISDKIIDLNSTSTSHSSETLDKDLAPSPYTKTTKKPVDDVYVPMYPSVQKRIVDMAQRRIDVCHKMPATHWVQPPYIKPLQMILVDVQSQDESVRTTSYNFPSTSSQPQPQPTTTKTSDLSMLDDLPNPYKVELPSYIPNSEKASKTAPDATVSEHEQETTQPTFTKDQFASDTSRSKDIAIVVEPISVAKPVNSLEATTDSSIEPTFETQPTNISTSVSHTYVESRTSLDWTTLCSMVFDVEMPDVNDDSNLSTSSQQTIDIPSSSTIQPTLDQVVSSQTTNVSSPPINLLDSIILKEVCENIFEDMNKLVKAKNNPIHTVSYEDKWIALRERIDTVMCELQKQSIEAQYQSRISWFEDGVNSMQEVEVNRSKANIRLYIVDSIIFGCYLNHHLWC